MDGKILIVDDEEQILEMIRRNLNLEGYEVQGEKDPKLALERIKKENFKIVVTDIKMPGMSGVELLKKIKEIDGTIQVIMITGYVEMNLLVSSLSNGANDCIFKPLDLDQLQQAIDDSIEKLERWRRKLGELGQLRDDPDEGSGVST